MFIVIESICHIRIRSGKDILIFVSGKLSDGVIGIIFLVQLSSPGALSPSRHSEPVCPFMKLITITVTLGCYNDSLRSKKLNTHLEGLQTGLVT